MSKANDNESFIEEVQTRLRQRGESIPADGWGGTDSLAALDRHFPSLKPAPAAVPPVAGSPAVPMPSGVFSKRTEGNLSGLNIKARVKLQAFVIAAQKAMAVHGVTVEVISGLRSWEKQQALFDQPHDGKDNDGDGRIDEADELVTKARAGSSWHNYGLAIDLGLFLKGVYLDDTNPRLAEKLYAELGKLAASMGIEWAGNWTSFPEGPHFQITFGLTLSQARAQMEKNGQDCQKLVFP